MSATDFHRDESGRLAVLRGSGILDTPPEERFDRITRLAARLFDVPISLVTVVDEHRQFFKSHYGLDVQETGRDVSFCAHILENGRPLVTENAPLDPRFADNPLVTGPPHIRAYAGVPLRSREGYILGALSVIDTAPRAFAADELDLLSELAGIVSDELNRSRQTIEHLDESQYFIDRVVSAVPGVLYVFDLERQQTVYANHLAEEALGYSAEELSAMGSDVLPTLMHPDDLGDPETWLRRFDALADGEVLESEYRVRHHDESWRWFYSRDVVFRRDEDGRPRQILGIAIDITTRKTYEEELLVAKQRAEEVSKLKGSILANMSHEIRTPLTNIFGFCELVMDDASASVRNNVQPILRNAERLKDTLTSVIDIARLEAQNFEVQRASIDVAAEVRKAAAIFAPLAGRKQIALDMKKTREPVLAHVDAVALRRIADHLIGNAIKFTDAGGVEVDVRPEGDHVVLEVHDTGVGISETFLPHLFETFRQESSGDSRAFEGNGLGLSITHKLVDLMGGQIQVESTKGEGTTFTVTLPAA